jgi:hypothetical protein
MCALWSFPTVTSIWSVSLRYFTIEIRGVQSEMTRVAACMICISDRTFSPGEAMLLRLIKAGYSSWVCGDWLIGSRRTVTVTLSARTWLCIQLFGFQDVPLLRKT